MKKNILAALSLLFIAGFVFAGDDILAKADSLYDEEKFDEGFDFIEKSLDTSLPKKDLAELYWRLSRFQLYKGDDAEEEGAKKNDLLNMFSNGQDLAEKAINLYPSADAYYWKLSNIGRWGETKGILDSLFKAKPMKDDLMIVIDYDKNYADAWYVLSRLYLKLPGWPISFGNKDCAVSFARRAVDLYAKDDLKITYYTGLAETLWERKWSVKNRTKNIPKMEKNYNNADDEFDRISYYEYSLGLDYVPEYANLSLEDMTDREEAVIILKWLIGEYNKISSPSRWDKINIQKSRDFLEEWE